MSADAESADPALREFEEKDGEVPERLAGEDAGQVEFDKRHGEDGQRIVIAAGAMGPRAGIDGRGFQLVHETLVNPRALLIKTLA